MRATGPGPLRLLLSSFLALIATGTALLMLPAATPPDRPIRFIDALFTATSATCVTGLIVRDTGSGFTLFGQVVILVLIQLGGIGIMTFSLLVFSLLGGRFSLVSRSIVMQTLAGVGYWEDLWPLLRMVIRFTLASELIGAMLLFARWQAEMGTPGAAYAAVFHAISAFCNAGFSLWPTSLMAWGGDAFIVIVMGLLIVLGGLGFLTIHDIRSARSERRAISLHTRLALSVTGILIVAGTVLFWILERHDSLAGLSGKQRLLASLFQSITCRTAGFNTVDIGSLAPATLFLLMLLMFIGGSPGSCAGGVKTTTFGVLALSAWNRLRRRTHVNAFRRTVSKATLANALSITLGGLFTVFTGLFLLLILESPHAAVVDRHGVFVGYFFEAVSAMGTVGLSTGVTPMLAPASRVLITALMFIGRLGPLTVAAALAGETPLNDWQYPEEDVMVG